MDTRYSEAWDWFSNGLQLRKPLGEVFTTAGACIASCIIRVIEREGGLAERLPAMKLLAYLVDLAVDDYKSWLSAGGKSYSPIQHSIYGVLPELLHMQSLARRGVVDAFMQDDKYDYGRLGCSSDVDLNALCAVVNLFDALRAESEGNIRLAIDLIAGAAILASGLDVKNFDQEIEKARVSISAKGGENRHIATEPLKAWLVDMVKGMHQETPFKSRAEAARDIELDLIEEAKKYNLKPSQFNPENARDFAERALKAANFSPKISV